MQKLNPQNKNNKPALFSFEDLSTEKGVLDALKALSTAFKSAGVKNILKLSGDSLNDVVSTALKGGRDSGTRFKPLTLIFDDGQVLQLRIKTTGDFYKVVLNKKIVPIKAQDDHQAAIREIAAKVSGGSDKFTAAMARKAGKTGTSPKTSTSKKKQIAELTVRRDELVTDIAAINEETARLVESGKKVISSDVKDGDGSFGIKNLLVTEKKGSTFRLFDIKEKITYRLFQRDIDIDLTIGSLIGGEIEVYGDLITSIKVANEVIGDSSKARVELPINDFKIGDLYEGVPILRFGSSYAKGGKKVAFAYFK